MSFYYDRDGHPIDMMTWARAIEDHASQVVRQDTIDGWFVSTVWLGLDHALFGGPPLIFETMIFPPEGTPDDDDLNLWQERYPTEDAARAGHDRALAMVRDRLAGGGEVTP